MPDEFEIGMIQQMADVAFGAREAVVHTQYIMAPFKQPFAQVGSEKSTTPGDHDPFG
jgi:hypothetical protein